MKTTTTTFSELIRDYENNARTNTTTTEYVDSLTALATAISYNVLRKCIDTSQNRQLCTIRRDIKRDSDTLESIAYNSSIAYRTAYNEDGDKITVVNNKTAANALNQMIRDTLGDGLDLVNTAVIAILDETNKVDTTKECFMEEPYTVRRMKRKVWIKIEESVNGWETVETTPIQEIYKAVRRAIMEHRAMSTDARNGYSYLEELTHDTDSDTDSIIYRRLPKYTDLGGYAHDYNGTETLYSVDRQSVTDVDDIIDNLELTPKQSKVLQLRLSGYGYKAIATYLGVTQRAVAKTCQAIQKKAVDSCIFNEDTLKRYKSGY